MTLSLCCNDPTLDELLDDDLTQTVMQADRVDAVSLRVMLALAAESLGGHEQAHDCTRHAQDMHRPFKTFAGLIRHARGLAGEARARVTDALCGCSGFGGGR